MTSKLNPKLDLVETTIGTPVETGGKAPYFFSKTTGKLHFFPKTAVLGKGWVWFRLELYWNGRFLGG